MNKREVSMATRKTLQAAHCIDYDTFCDVIYGGKQDAYTDGKFHAMRRNFPNWYCELDLHHADRFGQYVIDRNKDLQGE